MTNDDLLRAAVHFETMGELALASRLRAAAENSVCVPREPTPADWGAIQASVDEDCSMSIVADLAQKECTWEQAADRISAYAIAAFKQAQLAAAPGGEDE